MNYNQLSFSSQGALWSQVKNIGSCIFIQLHFKKALQNVAFILSFTLFTSALAIFFSYSSFYLFLFSFSTAAASRKPGVRLQKALINILLFIGAHSSINRNFADRERKGKLQLWNACFFNAVYCNYAGLLQQHIYDSETETVSAFFFKHLVISFALSCGMKIRVLNINQLQVHLLQYV